MSDTLKEVKIAMETDISDMNIGDKISDGTVYAGISPNTNKQLFAAPKDAGLTMTFNEAASYAKQLNEQNYLGHNDWRVPTMKELDQLYQNKDKGCLKNSFNETGSYGSGWYWSIASEIDEGVWSQRFSDGLQDNEFRYGVSSVRCVR